MGSNVHQPDELALHVGTDRGFPILDGGFLDDAWERDGPDPSGHEPAAGQSVLSCASGEAMKIRLNRHAFQRTLRYCPSLTWRRSAEYGYTEVRHFREDFSDGVPTKRMAGKLMREAFGGRRITALGQSAARRKR